MPWHIDRITYMGAFLLILFAISCTRSESPRVKDSWTVSGKVLGAGAEGTFDHIAVKDPSIVRYQGDYHLFYTARTATGVGDSLRYGIGCGYVRASTIDGFQDSERISIDGMAGRSLIAPQVFYFEPQKTWYLVAHSPAIEGDLSNLQPVFITNPDIGNPRGWSAAKEIPTSAEEGEFRIDFWVICNERHAYLFYSNQKGSLCRLRCDLEDFPGGFAESSPEVAIHEDHMDASPPWRMFEAAHIYHVQKENRFLALLEGGYMHPEKGREADARTRFIFAMWTDSLNGTWERLEAEAGYFLAEGENLHLPDGSPAGYTPVSHPELVRSGFDQRLEIEDFRLSLVCQSFEGPEIPDAYDYKLLPWELLLIKNH